MYLLVSGVSHSEAPMVKLSCLKFRARNQVVLKSGLLRCFVIHGTIQQDFLVNLSYEIEKVCFLKFL